MPIGEAGNESYQHVPGGPRTRVYLGAHMGSNKGGNTWDAATPATNHFQKTKGGNFTADLSQSQFMLFLQSPRAFYMKKREGWAAQMDSPSLLMNTHIGTMVEAHFDALRQHPKGPQPSPYLSGSNWGTAVPWIHPANPDFIGTICGRDVYHGWTIARTLGILYQRKADPHPMLNVYGELDEILEVTDPEDGTQKLMVIDVKSTTKKEVETDKWFDGKYAVAYRTQLEFYAWFLQQRMKAEGRSEEVIPIGLNVIFQIDQSQSDINDVSGGGPGLKFKTYVAETELDTSWIEDSIDLAIECLVSDELPARQMIPATSKRWPDKVHESESFEMRYKHQHKTFRADGTRK